MGDETSLKLRELLLSWMQEVTGILMVAVLNLLVLL